LPKSSPAEAPALLIAAVSGRALAAAARRAGLTPLVADFFADADTARLAHACLKLDGSLKDGMRRPSLLPALETLAAKAPSPPIGLVYGSGFEDRVALLAELAARWRLLGNAPDAVARVKSPEIFFAELGRLGIAHPRTVAESPADPRRWLMKRRGGAGGSHVARAGRHRSTAPVYFQEKIEGRAVSALFVGNGTAARVLGFSEQWSAPTRRSAWRYGGAVCPASLAPELERQMTLAVERAGPAFHLEGLGSADFLVSDGEAALLEINPRPGATLDIFDSDDMPLMAVHVDAVVAHRLPAAPLSLDGARAAAIVYASESVSVPEGMVWPAWTADRPRCGERIDKNRPICTVV
jgi:predicted ATP-grasp superfamily ATP-dependent carboligase